MPLCQTPSLSASAQTGTSSRLRLVFGFLLLGMGILSSGVCAEVLDHDSSDEACLFSSTCDGPNSTAERTPAPAGPEADCREDAELGLCESDPEAMFERCHPDKYCLNRENFGAVVYVETSVFRDFGTAEDCFDRDDDCEELAANDSACLLNPYFMREECPESCYLCVDSDDDNELEGFFIGVQQKIPSYTRNKEKKKNFYDVIAETASYMSKEVFVEDQLADSRRDCKNTDKYCSWWVASTHGDFCNDSDARQKCGPACKACEEMVLTEDELDVIEECTPNEETNAFMSAEDEDGIKIGDGLKTVDAMFRRIVGELPYPSSPGEEYPIVPGVNFTAKVLSRPSLNPMIHKNMPFGSIDFHIGGPWIVVLEDFLTPEECDQLIELGDVVGRKRSTIEDDPDDDEYDDDEEYEEENGDNNGKKDQEAANKQDEADEDEVQWRTSSTAWCNEKCLDDPIVKRVQRRIGLTTGVTNDSYYEELQLLKYVEGQYYMTHHDESGDLHNERWNSDGPRILTFFLYLSDVEEGGETRFSDLMGDDTQIHIDVAPKRGRALLWPSMHNEDLLAYDQRTFHAALEVKKGVKYGANAWLHLRNFRDNNCDDYEIEEVKEKLAGLIS